MIAMMRPATINNPVPLAPHRVYAAPTPADATRRFPVFMRCSHFFLALSMSRCEPQKWPVGHESETQRCCTTPNSSSVPSTSSSSMNTTGQSFAYLRAASSTDWNCGVTNAICSTLANGSRFAPSHSDGASALPQAMYMSSTALPPRIIKVQPPFTGFRRSFLGRRTRLEGRAAIQKVASPTIRTVGVQRGPARHSAPTKTSWCSPGV